MQTLVYLFLGTLAVLASVGALAAALDEETRLLLALLAAVLWVRWAFASYDVTAVSNGTEFAYSYPSMVYVAVGLAIIMLLVVVRFAFGLLGSEPTEAI
jgi:hypothetical protein